MRDIIKLESNKSDTYSYALYSKCRNYRYSLTRNWNPSRQTLVFILLNPSTATEIVNDPTVERCEKRTRYLGFGGFTICNIFAFRSSNPEKMKQQIDPIGKHNDKIICSSILASDKLVCAWGNHGAHIQRGIQVKSFLKSEGIPAFCFGLTKKGYPKHPLYLRYTIKIEKWF